MRRLILALLLLVAVAGGVAGYLLLRGQATGAADGATAQQASQSFFADRSGGTPLPNIVTYGDGGPGATGVIGAVTHSDGNNLVVKSPLDGLTTTVHLAPGAPVQKQTSGSLADLVPGTRIVAAGPQNGTALDAQTIQIAPDGASDGPLMITDAPLSPGGPGEPPPGATPAQVFISGTPGPDGPAPKLPAGATPLPASTGTITQVTGNTITMTTRDGTTVTVQVGDKTAIHKQVTTTLGSVQVGDMVAAQGTRQGDQFEATQLQIVRSATP